VAAYFNSKREKKAQGIPIGDAICLRAPEDSGVWGRAMVGPTPRCSEHRVLPGALTMKEVRDNFIKGLNYSVSIKGEKKSVGL